MHVVLATCAELPDGDEDAALLAEALAERGCSSSWRVWSDPQARWDDALVVLRSTWDYAGVREDFLAWAGAVPRLLNPVELVEWNTDKVYLVELAAAGIPTVSTTCFAPGERVVLPATGELVLKPSVGAGSRGAGRFTVERRPEAAAHAADLHAAGRTVVVQPYLDGVDVAGETALIYFEGTFSHAITKGAMLPQGITHPVHGWDLFVQERISPATPTAAELSVGEQAVAFVTAAAGGPPLYARVDLLPSADGPLVGELEVSEPSLFLSHGDGAAQRFAAAIAARA